MDACKHHIRSTINLNQGCEGERTEEIYDQLNVLTNIFNGENYDIAIYSNRSLACSKEFASQILLTRFDILYSMVVGNI